MDLEVGHLRDVLVLGKVRILLDDNDTLSEKVSIDVSFVLLGNEHHFSQAKIIYVLLNNNNLRPISIYRLKYNTYI